MKSKRIRKNNYFLKKINEHFYKNSQIYILLIIVFLIGLSLGIVTINNLNNECKERIVTYIEEFVQKFQLEELQVSDIIWQSIKKDTFMILILCFLGYTVIGGIGILLFVLFKGYTLGYAISSVFASLNGVKAIVYAIITAIPYLIYFPAIIICANSGINFYKNMINTRREEPLKYGIIRHAIICIIMLLVAILTSTLTNIIVMWLKPLIIKIL